VTDEPAASAPDPEAEPAPAAEPQAGAAHGDDAGEGGDSVNTGAGVGGGGGRRLSRLALWVTIVGGILGALVAAVTLYYFVFPQDDDCTELSGTLGKASIDQRVTYGEFLRITNQQDPTADETTLARMGTLISVTIESHGYVDKELPIRWTTLTSNGHLTEDGLTDQLALGLIPRACTDAVQRKLWARWPTKQGRYQVEISLLDDQDAVLRTVRTPGFAVPEH
jgi:hypothetical protein